MFNNKTTVPMEIARASKYLIDRGVVFMVELISTNYRRSPLVQGGLEIPAKVTVTLPGTVKNHLLINKYKEIVTGNYVEPKKEEILGSFLALPAFKEKNSNPRVTEKKVKRKPQSKDIRNMFRKMNEKNGEENENRFTYTEKYHQS